MNLASGQKVTAISTLASDPKVAPDRVVNGIQNDVPGGYEIFHSNQTSSSDWWETDLGAVQPISNIEVWNRRDCCTEREQNFYVFVSDVPFTAKDIPTTLAQSGVGVYYYGTPQLVAYNFPINRTGRYVRVQLTTTNFLQLMEVQVWSQLATLRSLSAPKQNQ